MNHKPQPTKGKVPPLFIYLEIDDLIIHNCVDDSGAMHNIIPMYVMNTIGLDFPRNYKVRECIFSINSRSVLSYGEIKVFCDRISLAPHIHIVFTIIVVDLIPSAFSLVLGHEWSYSLGGHIMNDGSCMMLSNKDGNFTKVPCEEKKHVCYQRKED